MNTLKGFFSNIWKHIWVYVLFCVVCTVASIYIIDLINKPRNEQTISILVASYDDQCKTFKEEVNKRKPDYLREIQYNTFSVLDKNFTNYYSSLANGLTDIVIIPESQIDKNKVLDYYAIFTNEVETKYFAKKEFYTIDNKDYGILIHKKGSDDNKLLTYYLDKEKDENYYLFFFWKSIHVGSLNDSKFDTAFTLMQVFNYETV